MVRRGLHSLGLVGQVISIEKSSISLYNFYAVSSSYWELENEWLRKDGPMDTDFIGASTMEAAGVVALCLW